MYKIIIAGLFSFFLQEQLFAFNGDSLVQAGNNFYVNNDFQRAADTWQTVADSGFVAPELFYNLGNAYYKMNNYAYAILYYERALLLDPRNKDARFNLELANAHIVDKIEPIPQFFFNRWIENLVRTTTSNNWAILSISAFILCLILLLVYLFSGKIAVKKISFYFALVLFLTSVAAFLSSAQRKRMIEERKSAIIVAPSVTVKSSPNEYGTNLFVLHEGTKVETIDNIGQWFEIKISNGNKGWVPATSFERI
ncbi:MAG: tetratricopeptide repeat protein [Bacteroidales bacterium]|nr:tetratricopeptide repeat protein [Bacteroidales bacterium]